MAYKHGVYVSEKATTTYAPITAESGIPFVVGTAPLQSADSPAAIGLPVLVSDFEDFKSKFGYSDDWAKYTLCEFAYSHFALYGREPAIFVNLLDPASMKTAVAAADLDVASHQVKLTEDAINSAALVVKAQGGAGDAYVKDTDYSVFHGSDGLYIELLESGDCYDATKLNVAYDKVTPASVTASAVAAGFEAVELCLTKLRMVPDLLVAPGFSQNLTVAAVMITKAANINGMFKAKALLDLDCSSVTGATTYTAAIEKKFNDNYVDKEAILCWPMLTYAGKIYHMSTQLAGLIAEVDYDNDGCPAESPSNKNFKCTGMVLADGSEVNLKLTELNLLNANGIMTALNFLNGWTAWGNFTCAQGVSLDVKDYFIPVSRMFAWVNNTLIRTFWGKLDKPMNRRLIDEIMDNCNIWLNGLTGRGLLLGGRAEFLDAENTATDLMNGIVHIHIYMTPCSPAQEIDFVLEYDVDYVTEAFQS
jgi:phage tail sheath protein FI